MMDPLLVGKLIEKCTQIEHALEAAGATGSGLKELMAQVELDKETETALKFVRRVRNACAHDGEVDDAEIREALQVANELLARSFSQEETEERSKPLQVRHFLILEILLVVLLYATAFCISLTPRALNIATILSFYLVFSWEIVYASRRKARKALLVETLFWLIVPAVIWYNARGQRDAVAILAASGILPLFHVWIATKKILCAVLVLILSGIAATAAWLFLGQSYWIAAGIAAVMFFALLAELFLANPRRKA